MRNDHEPEGEPAAPDSPISVTELRDYHQINAEVVRRLKRGATRIRLEGPAGHRLLLAGLRGPWRAVIEVEGDAGPELAAGMDAPNLNVVCKGASADGAGSRLIAGSLLLLGPTGSAVGYHQRGGLIVAASRVGPRAGLGMSGGDLVLFGPAASMAGERQSGGRLFLPDSGSGPHLGRDSRGGRRILASQAGSHPDDRRILSLAEQLRDRHADETTAA
ncbi:glutamate synthase [Paludisphaera soli]|uniref:glutamate synthase n=1 Tax=Paludisphaera soli TaxID=2712865 RepID=UPI0013EB20F6|nr:glutamate synthase [Paludisphaera soli]